MDLFSSDKFREESPWVVYSLEPVPIVGKAEIEALKVRATRNPLGSSRLCLHGGPSDALQEMIIINQRSAYVRPHAHIGKSESFSLIEGEAVFVLFDDEGNVLDAKVMGVESSGLPFYYRIGEGAWHALLLRSEWLVFHEATQGPFERARTRYPVWAPDGSSNEQNARYMQTLQEQVERHMRVRTR